MEGKPTAQATATSSFPIFGLLFVVLTILKIGEIGNFGDVSWYWIGATLLGPVIVFAAFMSLVLVVTTVAAVIAGIVFVGAWCVDKVRDL